VWQVRVDSHLETAETAANEGSRLASCEEGHEKAGLQRVREMLDGIGVIARVPSLPSPDAF